MTFLDVAQTQIIKLFDNSFYGVFIGVFNASEWIREIGIDYVYVAFGGVDGIDWA